ncbi:HEPN domain-containing protein [Pseudomaricurvus sp. HS19]|uniref:HEPN domain-containing protein n=1 Tax=Pseudomaricurvus sp. HS19 TaxID=2692626 RepID=UPI00136A3EB0|nr:HEPN domain-containing protein [Pseudomaricurvus sp. HS19]MYM64495.1 hypothetical protein [Pseudomaricurvus sp. HS19]
MYSTLKELHRSIRDQQHLNLSLRIHRALSWLNRAEQCDDADGRFIFLWIAFNAAYATEIVDTQRGTSERAIFGDFFKKLCDLDEDKRLSTLVWSEFPKSIRVLLDNPYVNADFWEFQRGNIDRDTWQKRAAGTKRAANASLAAQNTPDTLAIIFSRIYVLRNQLVHGGATWDSAMNREQIRDCVAFLEKFVVEMLQIMMESKPTLWGDACFPPVRDA